MTDEGRPAMTHSQLDSPSPHGYQAIQQAKTLAARLTDLAYSEGNDGPLALEHRMAEVIEESDLFDALLSASRVSQRQENKEDGAGLAAVDNDTTVVPAPVAPHDATNQIADYLRMRVDRLSRLVPSELESDAQMCANGEYVQLFDVQQLIDGIRVGVMASEPIRAAAKRATEGGWFCNCGHFFGRAMESCDECFMVRPVRCRLLFSDEQVESVPDSAQGHAVEDSERSAKETPSQCPSVTPERSESSANETDNFERAIWLCRALRAYPMPRIEPEGNGAIGLDWDEGAHRVLSITIDDQRWIGYAYLVGESRASGRVAPIAAVAMISEVLRLMYPEVGSGHQAAEEHADAPRRSEAKKSSSQSASPSLEDEITRLKKEVSALRSCTVGPLASPATTEPLPDDVPCVKELQQGFCDRPDHRVGSSLRRLRMMTGRTEVQLSVEALDHEGGRPAIVRELCADLAALKFALTQIGTGNPASMEPASSLRSEAPKSDSHIDVEAALQLLQEKNTTDGAALLPVDPSASVTTEPLPNEGWRELLVEADSMLSAFGHGRFIAKDEAIELSMRCRKAYEASR